MFVVEIIELLDKIVPLTNLTHHCHPSEAVKFQVREFQKAAAGGQVGSELVATRPATGYTCRAGFALDKIQASVGGVVARALDVTRRFPETDRSFGR